MTETSTHGRDHCSTLVRRQDEDRWLAAQYAKTPLKKSLLALAALRIELADLLVSDQEISVTHDEETVGFGVLKRSSEDQAQIDVAAFDVNRVPSQRGQNIEGVPMAFNLQIQGVAAADT